jgi:hypothetical protein
MQMKGYSLYLPVELVNKARLRGLNLSALLERSMHLELRDLVFKDQVKEILFKQCDKIAESLNAEPFVKSDALVYLAQLRNAINKIEGDAYIRVEE